MSILKNIESAQENARKEIRLLEKKIERLEKKKELLLALPTECPSCKGSGQERYTDAAGSGDWRECRTCRGLGKIGPIECECGHIIDTDMIQIRRDDFPTCPWCGRALGGQYRFDF